MSTNSHTYEEVLGRLEEQERFARRRALFLTIVPIVVATVIIIIISIRISDYSRRIEALERELQSKRTELANIEEELKGTQRRLASTQDQLQQAELKLRDTANLEKHAHAIDFFDVKHLASSHDFRAAEALGTILGLRGQATRWKLGGQNPEEGFDSPGFASYILSNGTVQPGGNNFQRLCEAGRKTKTPRPGDLACYRGGYTMFYFEDAEGRPFVIGMTPLGILALDPEFVKSPTFVRTELSESSG
jgi:hypothetical protein